MNNAELYMEFNEKCTAGLIVDRNKLFSVAFLKR